MKKRVCIFSFYDQEGYVDTYIYNLLKELQVCINRLLIVINGKINEHDLELLGAFTSEIYIRENIGYDAGAYKYILMNYLSSKELQKYDEVILCNDTFFGPLVPMKDIFAKMQNSDCDMWGMSGFFNMVFSHIQSYFLVFRKKILEQELLHKYFQNYINESAIVLNEVYCQFETGLFDYLSREHKMKYDIYAQEGRFDVYRSSFAYLSRYHLPIIKKKVFSNIKDDEKNILCTLSYIKYHTSYDVKFILESIKRKYDITISENEIKQLNEYEVPDDEAILLPAVNDLQIEEFIGKDKFYIYGAGMYAYKTYWRFAKNNSKFQGFIVSDNQNIQNREIFDYPVCYFSEVNDIYSYKVILGVNNEYASQIMEENTDRTNMLRIF